jgi:hypothetical protein
MADDSAKLRWLRLAIIVACYAVVMKALGILFAVVLRMVEVANSGEFNPPESNTFLLINLGGVILISIAVYWYLAKRHRASYAKAGASIAAILSVVNTVFLPYPNTKGVHPMSTLAVNCALAFFVFFLVGQLSGALRSARPNAAE